MMRRRSCILALMSVAALGALSACGGGKPNTLTVGGPGGQHKTVAEAVAAARTGDIVSVAPGTYDERIELKKDLQIVGQGKAEDVILSTSGLNVIGVVEGANLHLTRVTIKHTGKKGGGVVVRQGSATVEDCILTVTSRDSALAAIGKESALTARRNKILDCKEGCGIYANLKATALVEENEISGCKYGLISRSEAEVTMRKNVVRRSSMQGAEVNQDGHALIEDNTFEDCEDCAVIVCGPKDGQRVGMIAAYEKSGAHVIVRNNRMRGNANGVCSIGAVVETSGNQISDCKWVALRANENSLIVSEGDQLTASEEGLLVKKGAEAKLRNCTITGGLSYGVLAESESSATVVGCEIRQSQLDGIKASSGSKILVQNTKLTDNGGQGICHSADSTVEVSGNTIAGSGSLECPGYADKVKSKWSPEQRLWALKASAILDGRNKHRCDRLAGCKKPTEEERANCALGILDNSWGITTREDLLETIASMSKYGHHGDWQQMRAALERLTPAQRAAAMANPKLPEEVRFRAQLYSKYGKRLGEKGIKGFDLARCICLARWGYAAKFLTEEEAWNAIMPLAQQARQTFDSWDEFGTSYLVGRRFWSPTDDAHDQAEEQYKELIAPGGSWSCCKWDTDLTPAP